MKRVLLIIALFLFIVCPVFPQHHMKFKGIPIDGKIENFEKRMLAAGFARDHDGDADKLQNAYCYTGKFFGQDANIHVNFTHDTREVYEVAVFFVRDWEFEVKQIQKDFIQTLEKKYKYEKIVNNEELANYDYFIYEGYELVGIVKMFLLVPSVVTNLRDGAMFSVSYTDVENYLKYEERKETDI